MSVYERSGRWHYRFKVTGVRFTASTGLAATKQNENAAKSLEAQKRLDVEQGRYTRQVELPFPIAATEFLRWCHGTEYRRRPNTARRISGSFASLLEFFREASVRSIRAADIERYKTWRAIDQGVKDVTLRNDLNALSVFFRYAVRAEWRRDNPLLGTNKVARPSGEDAVRIHVLSVDEEEKYFSHARGSLRDVAKLILLQGARPEEIMSLRKTSYDRARGTIRIEGGKTRSARRTLNLTGESIEIVERRLKGDGPWLFPSPRVPNDHIRQLHTSHDSACQDAGLSFVLYDLRHTFATRMLVEAKVDMASLGAIMGHANWGVLKKYIHPTEEHQKEAMRKYDATRPKASLKKVKG